MTAQPRPYARFRKALEIRSVMQAEAAARELGRLGLMVALDYLTLLAAVGARNKYCHNGASPRLPGPDNADRQPPATTLSARGHHPAPRWRPSAPEKRLDQSDPAPASCSRCFFGLRRLRLCVVFTSPRSVEDAALTMLGQTAADGGVRAQAEQITAEAAKKHTGNTQKRRNGELLARAIRGAK